MTERAGSQLLCKLENRIYFVCRANESSVHDAHLLLESKSDSYYLFIAKALNFE